MTHPNPQPDVPAEPADVDAPSTASPPLDAPAPSAPAAQAAQAAPAATTAPTAPAGTGRRFGPSRRQWLGLAGAFLLGACLCGGAGVAIGAVVGHHESHHGSSLDGRDAGPGRGNDRRRGDDDTRKASPAATAPTTTPATTAPAVTSTPSMSPTPVASAS
jgi:hypothetical protein